jgi:hypothetical protein
VRLTGAKKERVLPSFDGLRRRFLEMKIDALLLLAAPEAGDETPRDHGPYNVGLIDLRSRTAKSKQSG